MNEGKKRVKVLPWPDKENCFLVISGALQQKRHCGDMWYVGHQEFERKYTSRDVCEARISFTYVTERVAIEWDGEHGPIQCWYKCDADYKTDYDKAREHWIFEYAYGSGMWTQIGVDDNNLVQAFNTGDYDHIFSVLKRFADERD